MAAGGFCELWCQFKYKLQKNLNQDKTQMTNNIWCLLAARGKARKLFLFAAEFKSKTVKISGYLGFMHVFQATVTP